MKVRRSPDKFLMTPDQYLAQAESLRATGDLYLARQFENLYILRGLCSLKAILALDALYGVSDVVLSAHADKVRMAIFFELNHGIS
jgi:hypothetical protein